MLEGVEKIFDEMQPMMKKLKKVSYEKNMAAFRETHGHFFIEMTDYVQNADDKEKAAGEMAAVFIEKTKNRFAKAGRISGRMQVDMNFFMIYYTFPAILLTGSSCAKQMADSLCSAWGVQFRDSSIRYADYDTIYNGFREKIFGIF